MVDQQNQLEKDVEDLFELLKLPLSDSDQIDKSTILSLFLYSKLPETDPQYLSYLQTALAKHPSQTLTKQQFFQLLLSPDISYKSISLQEMAGLFSIFDKKKVGSFGIEELLSGLTDKSIESEVRKDFEMVVGKGGQITPIEFYQILAQNIQLQQQQLQQF